jgi:hypothetical protein
MADIYKIVTPSFNGISSGMRMRMLEEFLQKQEIDILFLQQVTRTEFDMIRGYKAHTNIGIYNCSTAMLTREPIILTNITTLRKRYGCLLQRSVDRKYLCTLWDITQAGERRLTMWSSCICCGPFPPQWS